MKPKNRIRIAFSLITFILLGVLTFQIIWIRSIYQEEVHQLNNEVRLAFESIPQYFLSSPSQSITEADASTSGGPEQGSKKFDFKNEPEGSKWLDYKWLVDSINHRLEGLSMLSLVQYSVTMLPDSLQVYQTTMFREREIVTQSLNYRSGGKGFLIKYQAGDMSTLAWRQIRFSLVASALMFLIILAAFVYILKTLFMQHRLNQLKRDMINSITHELKTPVTAIGIAIEALDNQGLFEEREKRNKFLKIAKKESEHLNDMIENALRIASVDSPKFVLDKKTVDVHELLSEIKMSFENRLIAKRGRLDLSLTAMNSIVIADQLHLEHAIMNMIDNALKYCTDEPRVAIHTFDEKGTLVLVLEDNGIGISAENLSKIFDPFFRASNNMAMAKGFGLGLNYVKTIVERHHGRIRVESQFGAGSKFEINLPTNG